ncbi:endoplasmic reticulum aminopeptidase 1-like [Polypterus senegalus]|uniref:endoplasmic reticulum aminopeptidase 1-like n=1 Tax=Polypterus senegalus TaxID=55291 RepID=UPI001963CD0D|nr:endoplasmic reticulum aminopeptidase 1-like [Polypterus senegalus]
MPISLKAIFVLTMVGTSGMALIQADNCAPSESCLATNRMTFPWRSARLPSFIVPEHYHLNIHVDFATQTFKGQVKILIAVMKCSRFIVLHSKNLNICEAFLEAIHTQKNISLQVLQAPNNEQVAFISNTSLEAGRKYDLTIGYTAPLSTSFSGFYKVFYTTKSGAQRMLAATHFEPTSARKAFPCFDEPHMKALFSVTVVHSQQNYAISNMPMRTSLLRADGLVEDRFLHSLKMSSYLVAFVVSDFTSRSAMSTRGVKVSVFAPGEQISQTEHALHIGVKILEFFEEYFQIPYPISKLDLVAIPDFESGAMENWGLITFRETSLLYDPETSTGLNKIWVTLVTAHEIAHQWFGNLVTMAWWNDIWLNEGFASYMEFVATNHLKPEWSVEDQFLINNFFRALKQDSFDTSHQISLPVTSSTQIRQMFDVISYSKGACILRMLHDLLTEPVFRSGIQSYLREHSYGNAQQDQLWQALSKSALQAGRMTDVKKIMSTWTMQKGYPLVSLRRNGGKLFITQNVFTLHVSEKSSFLWQIPFTFYTSNSSTVRSLLLIKKEVSIDLPKEVLWIKANVNCTGFYRVAYDLQMFHMIIHQLRESDLVFSSNDRANLIDDSFNLASQGTLKYNEAFSISLYLWKEKEYLPIRMYAIHMVHMLKRFAFSGDWCSFHLIKTHMLVMLGELMSTQRWDDSGTMPQQNLRVLLLSMATGYKQLPATHRAQDLFYRWMESDGKTWLPRNLRGLLFRVGVRNGGDEEWRFLLKKYMESTSSTDKLSILQALCRTRSTAKKLWLLKTSLLNHVIKTQDFGTIIRQLASSPNNNRVVWKFVQHNWDKLTTKFSLGSSYLAHIVLSITSYFSTQQKYLEVKRFFSSGKNMHNLTFVRRSLEVIRLNILWLQKKRNPINFWLRQQYTEAYIASRYCGGRIWRDSFWEVFFDY